jgi:general secretion pathway protein I
MVLERKGFSLLEVLIAVAVMGLAFSAFISLSGSNIELSDRSFKLTLSTIAAHDVMDEDIYLGKSDAEGTFDIANRTLNFKKDFEDLMGYRISKVAILDDRGVVIEIYEVK